MQNGRNTAGQFAAGNTGRPKGSRNKATIAIESLLQGQAEALTQTAIAKALDGDTVALQLPIDHMGATRPKLVGLVVLCLKSGLTKRNVLNYSMVTLKPTP